MEEKKILDQIEEKYIKDISNYEHFIKNKYEEFKAERNRQNDKIVKLIEEKCLHLNITINNRNDIEALPHSLG